MTRAFLAIRADAYELRIGADLLARLDGGAAALLAGAGEQLRAIDIETAIERSEDWLMPVIRALHGLELHVDDSTGRLQASFTPEEIEHVFTHAFDAVAHGRPVDRESVADSILLRELTHHGALTRIEARP
ncbi:MAG: hypothetical protein HY854_24930 [Burkholderiales bacterium]|nr:hypothetical protein [Burkholderiales bacterium]